jgi:hypothetical protein
MITCARSSAGLEHRVSNAGVPGSSPGGRAIFDNKRFYDSTILLTQWWEAPHQTFTNKQLKHATDSFRSAYTRNPFFLLLLLRC